MEAKTLGDPPAQHSHDTPLQLRPAVESIDAHLDVLIPLTGTDSPALACGTL